MMIKEVIFLLTNTQNTMEISTFKIIALLKGMSISPREKYDALHKAIIFVSTKEWSFDQLKDGKPDQVTFEILQLLQEIGSPETNREALQKAIVIVKLEERLARENSYIERF